MELELNETLAHVLKLAEQTKTNIYLTGKAGTGKSTMLKIFREHSKKKFVILAPTGVAAINVKGQTIHSFFKFTPDITPDKAEKKYAYRKKHDPIFKEIDMIVIDEISMVRADLLDSIDIALRHARDAKDLPFGGAQMMFIGDLFQLPPVVTNNEQELFRTVYKSPYFFDANVFDEFDLQYVELDKIYRQSDMHFIGILNNVRNGKSFKKDISSLNKQHRPHFNTGAEDFYITLATTNAIAETVNEIELEKLDTEIFRNAAQIVGEFDEKSSPADAQIEIKVGAQVMMVNNDKEGRWVNGSIGKVVEILKPKNQSGDFDIEDLDFGSAKELGQTETVVKVLLEDGNTVDVTPHTWEVYQYQFNKETNRIDAKVTGSFTQFPLKLAWAITIHKSQGKTFEKVIIDMGRGAFAHGQTYVALSRCRSLEGIILRCPIREKDIFIDARVREFVSLASKQSRKKS